MAYYLLMIAKGIATYLYDKSGVVSSPRLKISSQICKRRVAMLLVCCRRERVCLFVFLSKLAVKGQVKYCKAT